MKRPQAARQLWNRLQQLAERQLPALTRLRAAETLPIALHRRRIYVLPTLFGLLFAVMLMVMAMGALNYNNNPALLLTCILGGVAFISVLVSFRNLDGLTLRSIHASPTFAGEPAPVQLVFDPGTRPREAVRVDIGEAVTIAHGEANSPMRATLHVATTRRGLMRLPRIRLWTSWPYGLFRPWSWLNPSVEILVYPRPDPHAPAPPSGARQAEQYLTRRGGDEFSALREYRASDPQRLIAWKASARHDRLMVRELENTVGLERVLAFDELGALDVEARIGRLTRWVLMAEDERVRYSLVLPAVTLGPDLGPDHRDRCLRELALL
ncbi:DUF58 domain-containing protein [Tahibacter amnicola]|uniref:DUF58 domain-containing protein n=1 Tax=Tahibacter amnicola TaxID=2976241 RepID=A0ABY6BIQ2_9GAMM|nr:DUF58 domain-containing protein [Tahibacter amnicola]UXI69639.1 DUF58 domain-containing protein [Tahibacter amnicola]